MKVKFAIVAMNTREGALLDGRKLQSVVIAIYGVYAVIVILIRTHYQIEGNVRRWLEGREREVEDPVFDERAGLPPLVAVEIRA